MTRTELEQKVASCDTHYRGRRISQIYLNTLDGDDIFVRFEGMAVAVNWNVNNIEFKTR